MIIQRLVAFLFLFILANANPIHQNARQNEYRQRRSLEMTKWQLDGILNKHLFLDDDDDDHRIEIGNRVKRSEVPQELRPVGGPINIEQLPAMLAARYVKRYPYSPKFDPATIG